MVEHDGCQGCKHEEKSAGEKPCLYCAMNQLPTDSHEFNDYYEPMVDPDPVNHPSHYCQEGSMECIDEMIMVFGIPDTMKFCLMNVWKYRKRAMFKNGLEDMQKSDWYMKKYAELKGRLDHE